MERDIVSVKQSGQDSLVQKVSSEEGKSVLGIGNRQTKHTCFKKKTMKASMVMKGRREEENK